MIMGPCCAPGPYTFYKTNNICDKIEGSHLFVSSHDRANHSAPFDATFAFIAAETLARVIDGPCVESDGFIELINILNNV